MKNTDEQKRFPHYTFILWPLC